MFTFQKTYKWIAAAEIQQSQNPVVRKLFLERPIREELGALGIKEAEDEIVLRGETDSVGMIVNNASPLITFRLDGCEEEISSEILTELRTFAGSSADRFAAYLEIMHQNGISETAATLIYRAYDQTISYMLPNTIRSAHEQGGIGGVYCDLFTTESFMVAPFRNKRDMTQNLQVVFIIMSDDEVYWETEIKGITYTHVNPAEFLSVVTKTLPEIGGAECESDMIRSHRHLLVTTVCQLKLSSINRAYVVFKGFNVGTYNKYLAGYSFIKKMLSYSAVKFDDDVFLRSLFVELLSEFDLSNKSLPTKLVSDFLRIKLEAGFEYQEKAQRSVLSGTYQIIDKVYLENAFDFAQYQGKTAELWQHYRNFIENLNEIIHSKAKLARSVCEEFLPIFVEIKEEVQALYHEEVNTPKHAHNILIHLEQTIGVLQSLAEMSAKTESLIARVYRSVEISPLCRGGRSRSLLGAAEVVTKQGFTPRVLLFNDPEKMEQRSCSGGTDGTEDFVFD